MKTSKKIISLFIAAVFLFLINFPANCIEFIYGDNIFSENFENGIDSWYVSNEEKCTLADESGNTALSLKAASGDSTLTTSKNFCGSNYRVSAKVKPVETLNFFSGGIIFRYETSGDFLLFRFAGNTSSNKGFELYKWQGGAPVLLTAKILNNFSVNEWHDVQIDVIDDYVFIKVDESPVFDGLYIGNSPKSGGIGARVYAGTILVDDISIIEIEYPENFIQTSGTESALFEPAQAWNECDELNFDGKKNTFVTQQKGASATWSSYPFQMNEGETSTYAIYTWVPENGESFAEFSINSSCGTWTRYIDQSSCGGSWVRIAAVDAMADTALTVKMTATENKNTYATAIKYIKDISSSDEPDSIVADTDTETVAVFLNQSGFDTESVKRATITNTPDDTEFYIIEKENENIVYTSTVKGSIADFSEFTPDGAKDYYLRCNGAVSYDFKIAKNYIERISVPPALDFMGQARCDIWERGRKGVAWRDSHQFSFEMNSLVMQYMSNPALYENLPQDIYRVGDTEFENLKIQNEPDIVWLMKFAAEVYYKNHVIDGYNLHPLIKEQMAYFLYLYPYISNYVSYEDYVRFRDMTIEVWGDSDKSNCYNVHYPTSGEQYNLFEIQTAVGNIKGQYPPGHSILPNLLMYEVLKRDGLEGAEKYFEAAYKNCEYTILSRDITSPLFSKGQRMSERILMEGLSYFLKMYPDKAPEALKENINKWASKMIARSDNLWDMRMASAKKAGDENDFWTGVGYAQSVGQTSDGSNEPGNEIGFQAASYAAAMVLDDTARAARLKEIGDAGRDNMFGRNPQNYMYFHDAVRDIEGADLGWPTKFTGESCGVLDEVVGRIDASPKEAAYPFNPDAGLGYVEGWVAFNTAWNDAIAYQSAANTSVTLDKTSASPGDVVTVKLRAPVNIDYDNTEKAFVYVTIDNNKTTKLELTEENKDSYYFVGEYEVPSGIKSVSFSYGIGHFEQKAILEINDANFVKVENFTASDNKVSAKLTGSQHDMYIIIAAYKDGNISEIKKDNISLNGSYEYSVELRNEYSEVKMFIWDDNMTPFTDASFCKKNS